MTQFLTLASRERYSLVSRNRRHRMTTPEYRKARRVAPKVGEHVLVSGELAVVYARDTISGFHMLKVVYHEDKPTRSPCEWVYANRIVKLP